jgi:hypothetical protein
MKYIERSGQKMTSHLGGLETERLAEEAGERVPTELEGPREVLMSP